MTRADRLVWWGSFLLFGLLGSVWALSVPPIGGPDEPAHVVKAATVVRGEWNTTVVWRDGVFGMRIPTTRVHVPDNYGPEVLNDQFDCWNGRLYVRVMCAPESSAVTSASGRGGLVGVAAVVLAVPPPLVYLMAVVNPSAAEAAAAAALWAGLASRRAAPRSDRRMVLRVAAAAAVLASLRPLSPAFGVVTLVLLGLLAADRAVAGVLWGRRSVRVVGAGVAVVWLVSTVHVLVTRSTGSVIISENDLFTFGATRRGLGRLPDFTLDELGLLSWVGFNEQHVPRPLVLAWLAAMLLLVAVAFVVGGRRARIVLVLLTAAVAVVPVLAQVLKPDVGHQGRYLLPLRSGGRSHRPTVVPGRVA